MTYPIISDCPVCRSKLNVTRLHCSNCNTTIDNEFELPPLFSLSPDQLRFVEVFITNRGNIREVGNELGISYPTVRGKLDEVIEAIGGKPEKRHSTDEERIISMLENGEISSDEAINLLKNDQED